MLFSHSDPGCSLLALPRLNMSNETSTQKHKASDGLMTPTAPFLFICLFIYSFAWRSCTAWSPDAKNCTFFVWFFLLRCAHCKHLGVAARALHACHSPPASAPAAGNSPPPTPPPPPSLSPQVTRFSSSGCSHSLRELSHTTYARTRTQTD